ncbi:MAG TPA: DUF1287 domain-containing protein [Rhizomicrobium sp.]|nr:DUF1287 domain-containing protein [Rhizomicrobium sp.]
MRPFLLRFGTIAGALLLALAPPCMADATAASRFVQAAEALSNPDVVYDGSYRRIAYPMGDVPSGVGVCADVIVRAYRGIGVDLQKLVHEDMSRHFAAYPRIWGMKHADANIDHRRVPNLAAFLQRHGKTLPISSDASDYAPGDIVTWNLRRGGSLPHIGIVTDRRNADLTRPLVMHNIGGGQVLEDTLFAFEITGHYRYGLD